MKRFTIAHAFVLATFLFAVPGARADIFLDIERDPLPLVDITVVLPAGFEAVRPEESGAAKLMEDVLEAGTASLDRQTFLDRLASFGASATFSVSNLYSVWSLSFPVVEGKDYAALTALVAENWRFPRLTPGSFLIAVRKLEANLEAGLDSDMSLGVLTSRRWIDRKEFGGYPITLDAVHALEQKTVETVWARDFLAAREAWAGVVAPESSLPLVRSILSAVFSAQGKIVEGAKPQALELREVPADRVSKERVFLVIDKPERTQTMTSVVSVSKQRHSASEELAAMFGDHVLVDSGLGSVFGEEIRTKRGLAYDVSGVQPFFLGYPSLGLATNPVRPKSDEALGVIASLVDTAYERATLIEELPEERWVTQWQSFLYGRLLDLSSPGGRLAERMQVAIGTLSPKLYAKKPTDWKTSRSDVKKTLRETWAESVVVGAVVGEAKELKPLVQKHFPAYRVVEIPYRDSILSKTYQ